jgi:CRP/FNR family cyclic AMP-dependent transcriptional regulator
VSENRIQRRIYQPGDLVFSKGDQGTTAFGVQTGEVEIFTIKDGKEKVLGTFKKNSIFGEMGLIVGEPRMASARCTESSTIIVISKGEFDNRLEKIDPFVRGLIKLMVHHIQDNREY